jgi:HAMP domain-containing protein
MKTNINIKILPVIIIGMAILSVSFLGFSQRIQKINLDKTMLDAIYSTKKTFYNLIDDNVKMFKLAITDFSTNQEFKNIFMRDDREQLFKSGQDLYAKHKELGVTHFYFIRKNGTALSRLHNSKEYDDKITRLTFLESQRTNSWGTGIELGQSAQRFTLRAVYPYFNNNELIGYVELGEEIDHFLKTMKDQTGYEYGIVVEKKYLDEKKWTAIRSTKGLRNNYNDLNKYVIVDTTMDDSKKLLDHSSIQIEDLATVPDDGRVFHYFELDNKSYVSGGFALYDAARNKLGAVVVTQDVSSLVETSKKLNLNILLIAVFGTVFICIVMVFIIRGIVVKPLNKVVEAATRVVGGDFNATADVQSKDEIGELSEMLNMVSQVMANTGNELEDAYRKLDISEKLRKSSEEKLNLVKQRIQEQQRAKNK